MATLSRLPMVICIETGVRFTGIPLWSPCKRGNRNLSVWGIHSLKDCSQFPGASFQCACDLVLMDIRPSPHGCGARVQSPLCQVVGCQGTKEFRERRLFKEVGLSLCFSDYKNNTGFFSQISKWRKLERR